MALKCAQSLLGALLVPAVALLGARWFDRRTGLLAAGFAAFDPVLVWHCGHIWSEVLFLTLLWWGFERLVAADERASGRAALVAGLCWGLAILTRETVFYFAPLAALWLAWRRPRELPRPPGLRLAAVFLLGCAIVVGPWAWRNHHVFGFALPLATRGSLNLWKGNAELPWPEVHRRYGLVADELEKHRLAAREAVREILARQPGWILHKAVREIPELWGVNNLVLIHLQNEAYGPLPRSVLLVVRLVTIVPYVTLLVLAAWGLVHLHAGRASVLLVGFLACYTALHVVAFGFPRFRLPAMPIVFLLAAWGWRRLRSGLELRHGGTSGGKS
jgi:4-amino-4-deoxy-L-arabinose transferase-like glycosyltransferase